MSSRTTTWMIAGLLVLLVAGGLWMSGIFDAEKPRLPEAGPSQAATERPRPPVREEPAPAPVSGGTMDTSAYSSKSDPGQAQTTLHGEATGIRITGVVLDPDGRPLADSDVHLIKDVSAIKQRSQDGEVVARLRTARNGTFQIENLVPVDQYIVQASHRDFTTERRHPIDPANPATLTLEIRLGRGLDIGGVVTDSSGVPLEGAEIQVFDMNVQTADPVQEPEKSVRTAADGTYTVRHLGAGLKRVHARRQGFSSDGRNALDVREGQSLTNINFTLSAGFTISGVVTDAADHRAIRGAQVTARPLNYLVRAPAEAQIPPGPPPDMMNEDMKPNRGTPEEMMEQQKALQARMQHEAARQGAIAQKTFLLETAVTDEQGRFTLNGLMEARYTLQVRATGYQANLSIPADAGATNLDIVLNASPRVSGRVIDDETGQPLAVFSIAAMPTEDPQFIPANVRQRFKDPDGRFEYVDVRPGMTYLHVEAEGYAGGRSEPLQIVNQESRSGIEVRALKGCTLRGKVTDSKGAGVARASVDLVKGTGAGGTGMADNPFTRILEQQMRTNSRKRAVTNATGEWTIPNVLAGTWKVKVSHDDYSEAESSEFTAESRGELTVPSVVLLSGATIRGFVKTKAGEPDARASVMLQSSDTTRMPGGFSRQAQTGPDGRFEFKGVKPGSYRVMVTQREGEFRLEIILAPQQQAAPTVTVGDGDVSELVL